MYDVMVVGAGPAGLAAGIAARQFGADVLIIEQGKPLGLRTHSDRTDVISGIGGAGVYSDGKFSFYPSATALWSVRPNHLLAAGYKWLSEILSSEGLIIPVLPCERRFGPQLNDHLHRKEYPSFYLPVDRRTNILLTLADKLADSLWTTCCVRSIEHRSGDYVVIRGNDGLPLAEARHVVLALGRLGALTLQESLTSGYSAIAPPPSRRVESGFRQGGSSPRARRDWRWRPRFRAASTYGHEKPPTSSDRAELSGAHRAQRKVWTAGRCQAG